MPQLKKVICERMKKYRVLAVDVDGTLVNSNDEITPAVREAIYRAHDMGMRIVVATGRRYRRARHAIESFEGLPISLVTASGALVKNPTTHETLLEMPLSAEDVRVVIEIVRENGFHPLVNCDTFHLGLDFYHPGPNNPNEQIQEYLRANGDFGAVRDDFFLAPPAGVYAGLTMGTFEEMVALDRILCRALPDSLGTHVIRSPHYVGYICEFASAAATKWSAIQHLVREWEIEEDAVCCVGDDINDISMLTGAGLGVAMGNAVDSVKTCADLIAPTHDEDGVAWVIGQIL